MSKRDYYEILGIAKNASADEIKKAYRKLAVQHHPDKQGGDEAKFKEIGEAYEVLKDSAKRQRYDQFGHAGVGGNGGGAAGNPFQGFGGNGQGFEFDFGNGGLGDIFGSFFGGGQGQQQTRRGRDVEVEIALTFEEAIFGKDLKVSLELEDTCAHCKGDTVEPGSSLKVCDTCKGSGRKSRIVNTIFGQIHQDEHCPTCRGRGRVPEIVCTVCKGKGTQRRRQDMTIKVPAGIDDGATIRLREKGEAVADGPKGDLFVHVRVKRRAYQLQRRGARNGNRRGDGRRQSTHENSGRHAERHRLQVVRARRAESAQPKTRPSYRQHRHRYADQTFQRAEAAV